MTKRTRALVSRRLALKALGAIPFVTTALAQSPPSGGRRCFVTRSALPKLDSIRLRYQIFSRAR